MFRTTVLLQFWDHEQHKTIYLFYARDIKGKNKYWTSRIMRAKCKSRSKHNMLGFTASQMATSIIWITNIKHMFIFRKNAKAMWQLILHLWVGDKNGALAFTVAEKLSFDEFFGTTIFGGHIPEILREEGNVPICHWSLIEEGKLENTPTEVVTDCTESRSGM